MMMLTLTDKVGKTVKTWPLYDSIFDGEPEFKPNAWDISRSIPRSQLMGNVAEEIRKTLAKQTA